MHDDTLVVAVYRDSDGHRMIVRRRLKEMPTGNIIFLARASRVVSHRPSDEGEEIGGLDLLLDSEEDLRLKMLEDEYESFLILRHRYELKPVPQFTVVAANRVRDMSNEEYDKYLQKVIVRRSRYMRRYA